jgi:hypothetical protein
VRSHKVPFKPGKRPEKENLWHLFFLVQMNGHKRSSSLTGGLIAIVIKSVVVNRQQPGTYLTEYEYRYTSYIGQKKMREK